MTNAANIRKAMKITICLFFALTLSAQTLTITVRDAAPAAQAYIEGPNIVGRCQVGGSLKEMVLPRSENVFNLTVGEGPEVTNPFSCIVSKRDGQTPPQPLPLGVYRIQCAAEGAVCLEWHRCDDSGCTTEATP